MRQLDFSDYKPYCTDDRAERFDAFWGPLDETRRTIAMVARDFFTFADEANRQMRQRYNLEGCDPKKSEDPHADHLLSPCFPGTRLHPAVLSLHI